MKKFKPSVLPNAGRKKSIKRLSIYNFLFSDLAKEGGERAPLVEQAISRRVIPGGRID